MILRTFKEYYPTLFNSSKINIEEFVDVVSKEQLELKYSIYLNDKNQNILTKRNMPWLDIGDLPDSYNSDRGEAFQVYYVPETIPPVILFVPWDAWNGCYNLYEARIKYGEFDFDEKNVTYEEIEETIQDATSIVTDFMGLVTKRERIKTLVMAILLAIFTLWAIILGLTKESYVGALFIIIFYFVILIIVNQVMRRKSNYHIRMSQFLVAVLCRAENNKKYLKKGVEVRPGFQASWIEFRILEFNDMGKTIEEMRHRFLKQNLNQKVSAFN